MWCSKCCMSITNDPHSMYSENNVHLLNMWEYHRGMSVWLYYCYATYIIRFLSRLHHSEFLDDHFYTTCRHCLQNKKRLLIKRYRVSRNGVIHKGCPAWVGGCDFCNSHVRKGGGGQNIMMSQKPGYII
jgi:hypothetical protein